MSKYPEFKQLQLAQIGKDILAYWQANEIFEQSISSRPADKPYTFYEGPPSANGLPGIHHVLSRSIKDIFCRYKTLKGFQVKRKGGWDTHGLPIELAVEKALGITKEDIGKKISVDDYNAACKKEVMRYTDVWNDLTQKMGYWVDLENPYITYKNEYIETLWWLLKQLHDKNLLYKGYTIQPFSPAAGTGLSSHELNQPGTYKNVKDTSAVAQFKAITTDTLLSKYGEVYFLAWTTTPWTLPSNTALAVGKNIEYQIIKTFNPYTFAPVQVIVAKDLAGKYFSEKNAAADFASYQAGDKIIPFEIIDTIAGKDLAEFGGLRAVGNSSPKPGPRFVQISYHPKGKKKSAGILPHVVIVGKGITFDTGGVSLKRPYEFMTAMKSDMAGSAAALGAISALPYFQPQVQVTVLMMLAENALSGTSQRPSDVITHYGGKTVEVLDTDAEGRLVLADGLAYADINLNPDYLIDIATLTGAATLGLGRQHAAMYTRDEKVAKSFSEAGERSGDRVWHMPLVDDYKEALESPIADLSHITSKKHFSAGSVTAALFLEHFAGDRTWVHFDIAGVARSESDSGENPKGGTGFGVRLLIEWLTSLS